MITHKRYFYFVLCKAALIALDETQECQVPLCFDEVFALVLKAYSEQYSLESKQLLSEPSIARIQRLFSGKRLSDFVANIPYQLPVQE